MTPLDSLASQLRSRLTYHCESLTQPGQDQMFHCGCIYSLITALQMLYRVQAGEKHGS